MRAEILKSNLEGTVLIPSSKSHTIRGVICGTLAEGKSLLKNALFSNDTIACINACRMFGAKIETNEDKRIIKIEGTGGKLSVPENVIDVMNSGTTLYFTMGIASLIEGWSFFTGDEQIRNRPAGEMIKILKQAGAKAFSSRGNNKAPLAVKGRAKGGKVKVRAKSSQYLSSILLCSPLYKNKTNIKVLLLNEKPYVEMTLKWLKRCKIKVDILDEKNYIVYPNQKYMSFSVNIPSDFSSAAFFIVAAALFGKKVNIEGLDMKDVQGDKKIIDIIRRMGGKINVLGNKIEISKSKLRGIKIDIADTPDLLPILSVLGCYSEGETVLYNGAHVREKETDRIKVMAEELKKMGANIEEKEDGLIIKGGKPLKGAELDGRDDHRVVMSLTVAGLGAKGKTIIKKAEAVSVTFPNFFQLLKSIKGKVKLK